jgi:hypothetical protein
VVEKIRWKKGELLFAFRRAGDTSAPLLKLESVAKATPAIDDSFVECGK